MNNIEKTVDLLWKKIVFSIEEVKMRCAFLQVDNLQNGTFLFTLHSSLFTISSRQYNLHYVFYILVISWVRRVGGYGRGCIQ